MDFTMFIALNGQRLLIDNPAGPEKYTYHIYNALAKIDKKNHYVIYFTGHPRESYFQKLTNGNDNFSYKVVGSKLSWTQEGLSKQLFLDKPDLFFTPVHTLPVIRPTKTKYVTMVHGLEFVHVRPKNFVQKVLLGKPERYVCKFSDALIVPSEGTGNAIVKRCWAKSNNIFVVNEGVNDTFYKRPEEEIAAVRKKYKIFGSEYFIFVGTVHPRKNLPGTIQAFSNALLKSADTNIKFVISGKLGRDYEESLNSFKKFGVEENVLYLGRAPDEDLPALISGSVALINFSLEEGFGLTLLEAMSCETPCLLSDIPPFREVCDEYAFFADPNNITDMTEKILKIRSVDNSDMVQKARERSLKFSWDESAKKTLDVFQNVVKTRRVI
jgi:glycosyltransferase involved in cell wall biosynthesis